MKFNFSHILFKYLIRNFISAFLAVFICFFFITSLLEGMELIRRASYGYVIPNGIIFKLTILKTISTISLFFPFMIFISTILFYLIINHKLELTVIRGFGVSNQKIAQCLSFVAIVIGILYIVIFDTISALSISQIKQIENTAFHKVENNEPGITITNSGLWFKDVSANNSYIIYAKSFSQTSNFLLYVRFFEFDENLNFKKSIHSTKAQIQDGKWIINNAIEIDSDGNRIVKDIIEIKTDLSLKNINRMTTDPKSISVWNISRYVNMLEKLGLSTLKYKIQLYTQLSSIIQILAFVLLATICCISYNIRNIKRYSFKIATALMLAFPIHFVNNVLIAFGNNAALPPTIATFFLPALSVVCFASYILYK